MRMTMAAAMLLVLAALLLPADGAGDGGEGGVFSPHGEANTPDRIVRVSLLSEMATVAPGSDFYVGIRQVITDGWHTYWVNPGDAGQPIEIVWHLPRGVTSGKTLWPIPEYFAAGGVASYGYGGDVVLLTEMHVPEDLAPGTTLDIRAEASWLVCSDICVPEEDVLSTRVLVTRKPLFRADARSTFIEARARLPRLLEEPLAFHRRDGEIVVRIPGEIVDGPVSVRMFPLEWGVIDQNAPQRLRMTGPSFELTTRRGYLSDHMSRFDGVLVVSDGRGATGYRFRASAASEE
jgi:DsbC/DsbD-like thiol-disulfide interchange protein